MYKQYCLLLVILLSCSAQSLAQSSIFDAMEIREPGKGTVTIRQPYEIRRLVGSISPEERIVTEGENSYTLMPGYRIQVFAGNNQRTSKGEAESKEKQIKELFADIPTYVIYNAPFWRLRVGDYITHEEAYTMMCRLVMAFPDFKKEIQIQREEEVRIPLGNKENN